MALVDVARTVPRRQRVAKRRRPRRTRTWSIRGILRAAGRALATVLAAPLAVRLVIITALLVAAWSAINWVYQVARKPTELFFPLDGVLTKTPGQTWSQYGHLFREHATAVMTPDLLAALAQVEASGDPVARTYWRWQLTWNPLAIYQPGSSAVGMFQLTDGTFAEARRYCIQDHVVAEDACWFRSLYTRVIPSHAVELTAALLDRTVETTLARRRITRVTLRQKQDLAAVIHLCGAGAADGYARRGFRFAPAQRCGDHDAGAYLARVQALQRQFARLAAG
jgi:hypothetical protein